MHFFFAPEVNGFYKIMIPSKLRYPSYLLDHEDRTVQQPLPPPKDGPTFAGSGEDQILNSNKKYTRSCFRESHKKRFSISGSFEREGERTKRIFLDSHFVKLFSILTNTCLHLSQILLH